MMDETSDEKALTHSHLLRARQITVMTRNRDENADRFRDRRVISVNGEDGT